MSLPVKNKPNIQYTYNQLVKEVPNVLSHDQLNRLKSYALDTNDSGLHRRGSKEKGTYASFYTCQVFRTDDEIYPLLDSLWDDYKSVIDFIEPYEIKSYVEGDLFEYHTDIYINVTEHVDRKINLIIQMSDSNEYDGGDLVVGNYTCTREKGSAIFFPAALQHQITPIVQGTRFSLIGHGWGPYQI